MENYCNPYTDPGYFTRKEKMKNDIRLLGIYTGFALICQILLQYIFSFALRMAGLSDLYLTDGVFQNGADIIIVLISFLLPYLVLGKSMQRVSRVKEPLALEKPIDSISFILAVVAGVGFCMLANIVTSYLTVFISLFGFELTSPDIPMPTGAAGVITTVIRVTVVAAITEELTLRGYVMGNLRKYGDSFAVIAAALVFAVMHGNLIQAPFAFIAGFGLGYLSIKTGTIWTGIVIHAANNFISVAISYATDLFSESTVNIFYVVVLYGFIAAGAVCVWLLKNRTESLSLNKGSMLLSAGEKIKAFFFNPAMLVALFYMLYLTSQYVAFNS